MTNDTSELRKSFYRPEIDGLRAISVLAVVLYHFGLGIPGGFVGVDVFFVISGYLITSIIVREIEGGSFSIRNFWARRIRRILPAISLVVASSLIAGIFVLRPDALVSLAKSSLAQTFIVSNVYFWKEAGYFTSASEYEPLLHTWSLSVEEQFYLFLPPGLLLVVKFFKRSIAPILFLAILFSLGLSIYGVFRHPEATFYLLPTRAWELLSGSFVALAFQRPVISRLTADILSAAGLLMIMVPMFLYSNETTFPGLSAVPPVLGAVLFIVANSTTKSLVGRILSFRPLVFFGLISYSLYLWHWPVISFSRHMLMETGVWVNFLLIALTLVLSILSWRFVETPLRHGARLGGSGRAFLFASITSSMLLAASGCLIAGKGFTNRFDANTLEIMQDADWTGTEYKEISADSIGSIRFGNQLEATPDYVLWGDSHAMVLGEAFDTLSSYLGLHGMALITPACPPVPGLWIPSDKRRNKNEVLEMNEMRIKWIIENNIKNVILSARWDAMHREVSSDGTELMVSDSEDMNPSSLSSASALERRLKKMMDFLDDKGINVWIIAQVPDIAEPELAKKFSVMKRFQSINGDLPDVSPSLSEYKYKQGRSMKIFKSLESPNVRIIDPAPYFFGDNDHFKIYEERSFYRDNNHLSRSGVKRFMNPMIEDVLKSISASIRSGNY